MKIQLETRVRIVRSNKYASGIIGKIGIVENSCSDSVGVKIDGYHNPRSEKGLFWFDLDEIEFIESEENIMLNQNENFKVAGVKFIDGYNQDKEYFYALFDDYCVGDLVVVQTGHHGLALAEISSIGGTEKERVKCSREIITRVDTSAFEDRQAKRKALTQLKKDMDKKVKELQETALYELLAEKDPALATMLGEYKKLTGGT